MGLQIGQRNLKHVFVAKRLTHTRQKLPGHQLNIELGCLLPQNFLALSNLSVIWK
jgi:hypothetical protein